MIRSTVGSSARACVLVASVVAMPALATGEAAPAVVPPTMYSVQFVAAAATGVAMNASGDVAGTSYIDTGCGPFCLPPQDTVVWRGVQRIVLPQVPGLTGIYVTGINAQGWVSGLAGFPGTTTHAIVCPPSSFVRNSRPSPPMRSSKSSLSNDSMPTSFVSFLDHWA